MDVEVTDAVDARRYEARADGELVGIAEYALADHLVVFTLTEVFEGYEGRGVAGAMVERALDDARARHREVVPACPFVRRFVELHRERYGDLVHRSRTPPIPDHG